MDERDLILRAQRGDKGAFDDLVRLHQARLRAFIARFVSRADDVYDLAQDAFLDLLRSLDRFDVNQELGPWLRTLARNRVRNFHRAARVRRSASLDAVDAALEERLNAPERGRDDSMERVEALRGCLEGLQQDHRELLHERYRNGTAVARIAAGLKKSAASISMMLMRLRSILSKCVEQRLRAERP